ncbi:hypothetical protein HO133_007885 [Letharia lupina]|uniref:Succinate dehydrogenase assembly factor 3 n=1 Tax=Letharia lupina TaxID=560253 RepID=A0A8H6FH72_9LECA|nr:uncharacterized protein HO133_007885 [Letharia lupina]KAF6228155.1 hypothetical protein HO133_007885 [Letharia lupina]
MRVSIRLLAKPTAVGSTNGLKPAPLALLPPIPLYRRLLRAHRKYLDPQMRLLGDEYIKSEYRSHRNVENPMHIIGFLTEWQMYAQNIEGGSWKGEKIDKGKIDKMSDQQLGQLYELMQAIQKQAHEDGARNAAKYAQELAKEKTCPKCDKNDDYDGKKIRMVKATVHATKFGFGPNKSDCGINLGKKTRKYGPKKEPSTMLLAEGGCVVM